MASRTIITKRVYEPPSPQDGTRILVDRAWPRGASKKDAAIVHWAKDLAPTSGLRKWFGHDPERWSEFRRRYREELAEKSNEIRALLDKVGLGPITLVFAARDVARNNAVVLKEVLRDTEPEANITCNQRRRHSRAKGSSRVPHR